MKRIAISSAIAAIALLAGPSIAGEPTKRHSIRCEATQTEWSKPRIFAIGFVDDKGKLKNLKVVEVDRVFTPGNIVASFSLSGGTARTSSIPNQRPGKWKGTLSNDVIALALDAGNGGASATLQPVAGEAGKYHLSWKADMALRYAEQQTAEGAGTCTEVLPQ